MTNTNKTLVVYYTWTNGNTERIARQLADATGADLLRIDVANPYPGDYDTVVKQGKDEVARGFEPELQPFSANPDSYDTICVGTPTWWYTMAPAIRSFMDSVDWSGKTFVPFMTNAGWPGTVIDDLEDAASGARVIEPMEIRFDSTGGNKMVSTKREVEGWIERVATAI